MAGAYDAWGPAPPLAFGTFLDDVRGALRSDARFVWPSAGLLGRQQVQPRIELPLWVGESSRGLNQTSAARALAAGLRLRPLAETVADTARWAADLPLPAGIGLNAEREAALLRLWRARQSGG